MKKFISTVLISLAFFGNSVAQTPQQQAIINEYTSEVENSVARMKNPATKCNTGAEPFSKFIEQFSTDKAFFDSRIALTDAQKSEYAELLVPENFTAKLPFVKDDDVYYQTWGETQGFQVYLECGWCDSYSTHTFEFKRKGNKWYLSKIVPGE